MPKITNRALMMSIQCVEAEIQRVRALPEDKVVPGDEVFLNDLEIVAEELEEQYEDALETADNLPPYNQLVNQPDDT